MTWLLHLLSICVTYEKELLLEVRVAGILIYPKKERSGKRKKAASGADAEEGVGDADADTNVLDVDGAKMPSADVKTLGESAPAAGTTDEPQTQTVAEASEPQSADPRGSATTRMPDVESQSTDPNETSASEADAQATDSDAAPEHPAGSFFEKLSGKLSQVTDRLRGMQQKTDQLKQQTAYYKRIWDQPQTRQAIRVGFYELGEISDMYCRESWRFLESSGQAIRLLPDRSWRYRECCIPGIKEISGWNRILKRNISKENFTSKAESGLEPSESAD